MGEPDLGFQIGWHHLSPRCQGMARSAQDAHPIIDERRKLQPVRGMRQALRTKYDIDLTSFQHGAKFVHKPGPHLDSAVRVFTNETGHGVAKEPARDDGRRSDPKFADRALGCLICKYAGLFLCQSNGLTIAR